MLQKGIFSCKLVLGSDRVVLAEIHCLGKKKEKEKRLKMPEADIQHGKFQSRQSLFEQT